MSLARSDHAAIDRLREALLAAVNRSDAEGAVSVWSEEGRMMPPHHPTLFGRPAIRAHLLGLFARRSVRYTFTSCDLYGSGDTAVERVEYHVVAGSTDGGDVVEDEGKGLHVYRRQRDGTWRLSEDIWSSDRAVAAENPAP